ncbi:Snf7 family protein [Kipferlia bialata]|uniref:Snf7 family protein n=1 Tax=Kipferlia bialata TaxID=797122 RepID=A0A9K3GGN7_9EUKA|nr:Snf7 family protein [Kipferlia bialata]|eukprot:g3450.t1
MGWFGKKQQKAAPLSPMESIQAVNGQLQTLDAKIVDMEQRTLKFKQQAQAYMKAGQKSQAVNYLKQSKMTQGQVSQLQNQRQMLQSSIFDMENAMSTVEIVSTMEKTNQYMGVVTAQLKPERMDAVVSQAQEQKDDMRESEILPTLLIAGLSLGLALVILTDKNMRSFVYFQAVGFALTENSIACASRIWKSGYPANVYILHGAGLATRSP